MPSLSDRERLIEHLKKKGIFAVFHYVPLHLSEIGRKFGYAQGACPMAESASERLVRLPFYNDLTDEEQAEVLEAVMSFNL